MNNELQKSLNKLSNAVDRLHKATAVPQREAKAVCCRTGNPNNYSYRCAMGYSTDPRPNCVRTIYSDCKNVECSEYDYDRDTSPHNRV